MSEALAETGDLETPEVTDAAVEAPVSAEEVEQVETPEEVAAPTINWDDPEVQMRLAEMSQSQVEAYLQELAAQAPQPQAEIPPIPDPFSDNYTQELEARLAWEREQVANSIRSEYQQREQAAYVEQQVTSLIETTAQQFKIADEDKGVLAFLANEIADSGQVPATPEGAQLAARKAAEQIVARDKRIADEAVKAYREGAAGVQEQAGEAGINGAAISARTTASSYEDATRRVLERHGIPYN